MNRISVILFALLVSSFVFADSATGNQKTDALLDSCKAHVHEDNVKVFEFATELEKEGKQLNNAAALAYAFLYYGVIDESHGDMDNALKSYKTAYRHATASKDKTVGLRILLAISTYYMNVSDFKSCISACHKGIDQALAIKNNEIASQFYNNLSLCHSYMSDYKNALKYNDKSIELKKGTNDENALANAYLNRGLLLTAVGDYPEGFDFYHKAEVIYLKEKNYTSLTQVYINFGWDYADLKKFSIARNYLSKAMDYSKKAKDKIREAGVWNALGHYYQQNGSADSLTYALEKGYQISRESKNLRNAYAATKELSAHYQQSGNLKKALEYMQLSQQIKDSIFNETRMKTTQSLNARFDAKQNELTIAGQNEELAKRQLWIVVITSLAILLIIGLFLFQYKRRLSFQKEKNKAVLAERDKGLKAIINAQEDEKIRIARELHDGIGNELLALKMSLNGLLPPDEINRPELEKVNRQMQEVMEEVRSVSHQMMPRVLQEFGCVPALKDMLSKTLGPTNIKYSFEAHQTDKRYDQRIETAIYRIMQELINNVVKHSGANSVFIQFLETNNTLVLFVEDDGKGMKNSTESDGIGMTNITSRMNAVNGEFNIASEENNGTVITLRIPL